MRSLSKDTIPTAQTFPVASLLDKAYEEACNHLPAKATQLSHEALGKAVKVSGNEAALTRALAEVMLNGLQATPDDPQIGVSLHAEPNGNGTQWVQIEVRDNGPGFTPEAAQRACEPFFTTRNVGVGLGLTVADRIVKAHHGKLEILPPKPGQGGTVRISLPLDRLPAA
jgi:signal transduction histidine kinase